MQIWCTCLSSLRRSQDGNLSSFSARFVHATSTRSAPAHAPRSRQGLSPRPDFHYRSVGTATPAVTRHRACARRRRQDRLRATTPTRGGSHRSQARAPGSPVLRPSGDPTRRCRVDARRFAGHGITMARPRRTRRPRRQALPPVRPAGYLGATHDLGRRPSPAGRIHARASALQRSSARCRVRNPRSREMGLRLVTQPQWASSASRSRCCVMASCSRSPHASRGTVHSTSNSIPSGSCP